MYSQNNAKLVSMQMNCLKIVVAEVAVMPRTLTCAEAALRVYLNTLRSIYNIMEILGCGQMVLNPSIQHTHTNYVLCVN